MPTNKNASIRYQALDKCFRDFHHRYYIEEQYNNRWFLMAWDSDKQYIANLALDRILSLETTDARPFIPNTAIDFDNYFNDVIGVTIPEEVTKERIILRLNPRQYAYVTAKPLHASQQIVDASRYMISIEVKPNYEPTTKSVFSHKLTPYRCF